MANPNKPYGKIYMLPCPISEGNPYDVLPEANRAVMAQIDYFVVENVRSARRFLSAAKIGRPIEELEFAECNEHTSQMDIEPLLRLTFLWSSIVPVAESPEVVCVNS